MRDKKTAGGHERGRVLCGCCHQTPVGPGQGGRIVQMPSVTIRLDASVERNTRTTVWCAACIAAAGL